MTQKRLGRHTVQLQHPPTIHAWASVVGKKEGDGPLVQNVLRTSKL